MKKYTQEDLNSLIKDDNGILVCPSGDYTLINSFGESCSFGEFCLFGESCSFGKSCSFGESCSFGKFTYIGKCPYIKFGGLLGSRIGSETYVFNFKEGIYIRCGCFFGTYNQFVKQVKDTKTPDDIFRKAYLQFAKTAKMIFDFNNNKNNNNYFLFGILVRDTKQDERDLKSRYNLLIENLNSGTKLNLSALYIPIPANEWNDLVKGGEE